MSNIEFLAKALSLHTKGKDASFLKESAVVEAKCSCCGDDPCSCPSDCKCKVNEGTDLKNDKNHNGVDDKEEKEPKDNTVKKTEKMSEEALTEAEEAAVNILEKLETVYDEAIHLQGLLEHLGYDLDDLFAIDEDADEEMQEGFANVSKAKRLIAQRKAAMRRRLSQGAKPAMPKR